MPADSGMHATEAIAKVKEKAVVREGRRAQVIEETARRPNDQPVARPRQRHRERWSKATADGQPPSGHVPPTVRDFDVLLATDVRFPWLITDQFGWRVHRNPATLVKAILGAGRLGKPMARIFVTKSMHASVLEEDSTALLCQLIGGGAVHGRGRGLEKPR